MNAEKAHVIPIDSVRPYWRNPRKTDAGVESVAKSIEQFGFNQPIVADRSGVLLSGHTRLRAARKLGLTEIPVVYVDLSQEEAKAYRIADNATGEIAGWDEEALSDELAKLNPETMSFFFKAGELDSLIPTERDLQGSSLGGHTETSEGSPRIEHVEMQGESGEPKILKEVDLTCPHCLEDFKFHPGEMM